MALFVKKEISISTTETVVWKISNGETLNTDLVETGEPIIMADGQDLFILNKETVEFEPYTPPAE
jgi:hypothetical protein